MAPTIYSDAIQQLPVHRKRTKIPTAASITTFQHYDNLEEYLRQNPLAELNSCFLGARSAPHSLESTRDTSHSDSRTISKNFPQEKKPKKPKEPAKSPFDPFVEGSRYHWMPQRWDQSKGLYVNDVTCDDYVGVERNVLDIFAGWPDQGMFQVIEAWNGWEEGEWLALRDIIMSAWNFKFGKEPKDLKTLYYSEVLNEEVEAAVTEAVTVMGLNFSKAFELKITRDGRHHEKDAFERLGKDNPFGVGAQKMID